MRRKLFRDFEDLDPRAANDWPTLTPHLHHHPLSSRPATSSLPLHPSAGGLPRSQSEYLLGTLAATGAGAGGGFKGGPSFSFGGPVRSVPEARKAGGGGGGNRAAAAGRRPSSREAQARALATLSKQKAHAQKLAGKTKGARGPQRGGLSRASSRTASRGSGKLDRQNAQLLPALPAAVITSPPASPAAGTSASSPALKRISLWGGKGGGAFRKGLSKEVEAMKLQRGKEVPPPRSSNAASSPPPLPLLFFCLEPLLSSLLCDAPLSINSQLG